MRFVKMQGLGNDFVVLETPDDVDTELVRRMCARRTGVGADGLLAVSVVERPTDGGAALRGVVRMRYWNADGSVAEMCGNGLRCVARYAVAHRMVRTPEFVVQTPVGPLAAHVDDELVRVELGPVDVGETVEACGRSFVMASVGNPHAVTLVDDPGEAPVDTVGPELQSDPVFPDGVNVEFVQAVATDRLTIRVWERGVGETLACGTGAVAAAAVAHYLGHTTATTTVELPGGPLRVEIVDGRAWITGPAVEVFSATWPLDRSL